MGVCTIAWAENNTTNIISGVATNAGAVYIVGQTGSYNDLEVRGGGGLTNGLGIIGYSISAANNSALVTGIGSRWINISNLYVGFTGPANHLTITNGGVVKSDFAYVSNDNNSTNNTVLVTGAGSRWETADDFLLGYGGPGNRLTITNGGQILCHSDSFVGGFDDSGSDNLALVTGSGSVWSNDGDLYVGYFSDANQLVLSNGGRVTNQVGYLGAFGSFNNKVLVNGTNSVWSIIGGYLSLGGQDSDNNQLVVTNGGFVNCLGAYLGNSDTSETNQVVVTGAGSRWNNNDDFYAGYYGCFNRLTIQNGGQVTNINGYLGYNLSATHNSVLVSGAGTRWQNKADLYVGFDGGDNQLTIANTGQVISVNGYVGGSPSLGSSGNTALVTDPGSQWSNSVALEIGFSGQDNELVITNGGKAICSFGRVGTYGDHNLAVVTGTNSQWLDSGDFYLGQEGSGNMLRIENGGLVTNLTGYVGFFGSDCTALVTGPGSQWQNWNLIVGYGETDNQLGIANAALVRATNVVLGFLDGSTDNLLSVSGASLIVTNSANTAQIEVRRGALALTNGTVKTVGLQVSSNGVLTGTGMVTASGVTNSGAFAPGGSPGSLTINGSLLLQTNSLLAFELGGYSPGVTYDFLNISNTAKLGGALSVAFINGFGATITNGASFTLMMAASLSGAFTNVASGSRLLTKDGFADFVVTYAGGSLVLSQPRVFPRLVVNPPSLNFGSVAVGSSATQAFQVVNASSLIQTGSVSTTSPFAIASGGSFNVNPGSTGLVLVSFSPTFAASFTNLVAFVSSGGNATNQVTGASAMPPQLGVMPEAHDFGTVALGTTANFTFVVTNSGGSPLAGNASIAQGPFTILSGTPLSLAALASTNLIVRFAPTNAGSFSAGLILSSDGGRSTNPLTGVGAAAPLALFDASPTNGIAPLTVNFTDTSAGTITNRSWQFGDATATNTASTNLLHTYLAPGTNTVMLTVSGPLGISSLRRENLIFVASHEIHITSVQINGNDVLVQVTTVAGRSYQLESRQIIGSGAWSPVGGSVPGTGATVQLTDAGGAGQRRRFYRVRESP